MRKETEELIRHRQFSGDPYEDESLECRVCGALVGDWKLHLQWHLELENINTPSNTAVPKETGE